MSSVENSAVTGPRAPNSVEFQPSAFPHPRDFLRVICAHWRRSQVHSWENVSRVNTNIYRTEGNTGCARFAVGFATNSTWQSAEVGCGEHELLQMQVQIDEVRKEKSLSGMPDSIWSIARSRSAFNCWSTSSFPPIFKFLMTGLNFSLDDNMSLHFSPSCHRCRKDLVVEFAAQSSVRGDWHLLHLFSFRQILADGSSFMCCRSSALSPSI